MSDQICPSCGRTLPEHTKFCIYCGSALPQPTHDIGPEPAAATLRCAVCGQDAEAGQKFCRNCGAALTATARKPVQKPTAPPERNQQAAAKTASASVSNHPPVQAPTHTYTGTWQQPAPTDAPAYSPPPRNQPPRNNGKRSGHGPLAAVLSIVLVAAILITGFWQPGFFRRSTPDPGPTVSNTGNGNSAAFSVTPLPGFTVSAEENALDRDRTFDVTEVSEDTFTEVSQAIGDGGILMELYELDSGLPENESFPGTFSMTYDLAAFDIPEELYNYLTVYRISDDGAATELICTVEDGRLTCRSDKNCGIGLVLGLAAWGASFFVGTMAVEDYTEKWKGLSGKSILHADICGGQYRVNWAAEDNSEWIEKKAIVEGLLDEIRQRVDYELADPDNTGYSNRSAQARNKLLAQRISENQQFLTYLKEFETLNQNMQDGTPQVKQVITALTQVHKYLAVTKGYDPPSSLTDVLLIYDWPAGDGSLGYANNPKAGAPYMQINMTRFPGDGQAASPTVMDELYLTITHELFHVFQVNYTTIDWNSNTIFWEATACLLEQQAQSDYLSNNSNQKDNTLPSMSAKQALTDTDWFETLSVTFGEMPPSGDETDAQRNGYTLSRFVSYIQAEYGCDFKLRALLETFKDTGDFRAALQLISGFSDDMLSNAYKNFCRENAQLFYTRYQNASSANGVKSTLIPAVQLSASNAVVDVPVSDAPLSAYIRAFKVDTKSVGGEYALLLVSDPSMAAKQDYNLVNITAGVTKTTKGLFYPVKTGASSYLFEIHSYAKPDSAKAFYTAYLLAPPEAPAISIIGNSMTIEMPPKSQAAQAGLIDGYLITVTASDGVTSVSSEERVPYGKWGDPLKLKLSELSTLTGEVTYSVTAQEYMKDQSGQNNLCGPKSAAPEATTEEAPVSGIYTGQSSGQYSSTGDTFELRYPAIRIEERSNGLLIGPCMENGDYEAELQVLCTYNADTGYYEGFSRLENGDQWTEMQFRADIHLDADIPSAEVAYLQTFSQHSTCTYYFEVTRIMDLTGQAVSPATGSSGSGGSADVPAGANPMGGVPVGGW